MALLEVENLSIGYQTRSAFTLAVRGVSFSLDRGASLGLVGESGCGKTTVGMALLGLLPSNAAIQEGRILFEGRDLLKAPEEEMRRVRWKKIAMIFQAAMNALNPVHRVDEQVLEAIRTHYPDLPKEEAMKQVEALFDLVEIPRDRMRDFPHQYSGGMKQRAIIAMALSCQPLLMVADEPTTALDVIVQDQILKEIKTIQSDLNIAVIFISHDIAVVADVSHDIGVMFAGQMVEYGPKDLVFRSPRHPYTRDLLSSYLTLEGAKDRQRLESDENLFQKTDSPTGCAYCNRCKEAEEACRIETPEWKEIEPNHKVLCRCCR